MKKQDLINKKKKNARIYPLYCMFSRDLIFYYTISFVFLINVKNINASEVMLVDAIVPIIKILVQIPSGILIEKVGKKKSLILADISLILFLVLLMFAPNLWTIAIIHILLSLGLAIKGIAQPNLLYDSLSHRNGKGMFAKLVEKGERNYYLLDGISSIFAGILFSINGYLPMYISIVFVVISMIITTQFKEIYVDTPKKATLKEKTKDTILDLKEAFKFILHSDRLKSFMLFTIIFDGTIYISYTLREGLFTDLGGSPEYFAITFSLLSLISGMCAKLQDFIHKRFKNKALTVMSMTYIGSFIIIGLMLLIKSENKNIFIVTIPIMYTIQYVIQSPYFVLKTKYLKSFATHKMRVKIEMVFGIVQSISEMVLALIASSLIASKGISSSFLILGITIGIILVIILMIMKTRFGLKPEEYKENDIEVL